MGKHINNWYFILNCFAPVVILQRHSQQVQASLGVADNFWTQPTEVSIPSCYLSLMIVTMQKIIDTDTFFSEKLIIKIRVWTGKQRIVASFNLGFLQQSVMAKLDENSSKIYLRPILNTFGIFEGREKFSWKT